MAIYADIWFRVHYSFGNSICGVTPEKGQRRVHELDRRYKYCQQGKNELCNIVFLLQALATYTETFYLDDYL